jgi:hypothetical protein
MRFPRAAFFAHNRRNAFAGNRRMTQITLEGLQHEWELLHRDHETHERYSLAIKLTAVVMSFGGFAVGVDAIPEIVFILVLWLQDGIWKTFQARIGARLLAIENMLRAAYREAGAQYQLYTHWHESKGGAVSLLREYVANALRPTVAYPYAALAVVILVFA